MLYQALKNSEQKRNSSLCNFISREGTMCFGSIHCFCLCGEIHVAIIETFESIKDAFEGMRSEN